MQSTDNTRFGQVRPVPQKGYNAYYPHPLPEELDLPRATVYRLAEAEAALGRLNGAGRLLPNPHLLIRPYMLREALASTRIEGTRASLAGVLEAEAGGETGDPDIEEVMNYVKAMELGLTLLDELPFSLRLIKEMHAILLDGVRGRERQPGEIRRTGSGHRDAHCKMLPSCLRPMKNSAICCQTGNASPIRTRQYPC